MDLFNCYYLGSCIESLKIVDVVLPVVKTRKKTGEVPLLETFRQIGMMLDVIGIEGTVRDKVVYWTDRLSRAYKSDQKLRNDDSEELYNDAKALEMLLFRDLFDRHVIELNPAGALNPKELLKTSMGEHSNIFDKKMWTKLPKIVKSDFADCAKCLLTGAATPATMVGLRGIEAVIKAYYSARIGDPKKKMLGNIIDELRSLPDSNEKLLGYLDYLRSEKRNLAQHPNKIFSQREAERIFMEIVSAVHDIYQDIDRHVKENKNASSSQLIFDTDTIR